MAGKVILFPVRNNLTSQGISVWVREILSYFRGRSHLAVMEVWKPLSGQIAHSFGQVYIWLSVSEFQNLWLWQVSLSSCMLRTRRNWSPSTWLVCGHFKQIHFCMGPCFSCMYTNNNIIHTCRNDLSLVLLLIVFTAALPPTISSTHHYWHTSQIIKLLLLHLILEMAWVSFY